MSRIMAIDYGKKRTGIAVTDPQQIIANGLTTVPTHQLWDFLATYLANEPVAQIVLGLPQQTNGLPSENEPRVRAFAKTFAKKYPNIPLSFYDERFTSVLAHKTMLAGGLKKKARQNKALVDEISATIILQSYLESNHTIHL